MVPGLPFRVGRAEDDGLPLDGAHAAAQQVVGFLQSGSTSVDAAVFASVKPVLVLSFLWRILHSACVLATPPLVHGLLRYVACGSSVHACPPRCWCYMFFRLHVLPFFSSFISYTFTHTTPVLYVACASLHHLLLVLPSTPLPLHFRQFSWFPVTAEPEWKGHMFGVGIALVTVAAAWFRFKSSEAALAAGLRVRGALCTLAFQRAEQLDWGNISSRSGSGGSSASSDGNRDAAAAASAGGGAADKKGKPKKEVLGADATTAPLGRLSELMGRSAGKWQSTAQRSTLSCLAGWRALDGTRRSVRCHEHARCSPPASARDGGRWVLQNHADIDTMLTSTSPS